MQKPKRSAPKKPPIVADDEAVGDTPLPPRTRLTTIGGIMVHLRWAIQEVEHSRLDPKVLNALSGALTALTGIMRDHDLAERITALEAKNGNQG